MRTTKGGGVPTIVRCAPTFFAATMLIQKDKKMTAVQVNAQNIKLLQGIGAIADSDPLMNRLAKYVERLLSELREHPRTGLGHPEPLKGKPEGRWSRELTKKHRLVYRIYETEVEVLVISAYGHYDDK